MDLISIIVPVYNVEQYLRDCIESIINQSYRNLQIILVVWMIVRGFVMSMPVRIIA